MGARISDEEISRRLANSRNAEYTLHGPGAGVKTKTSILHIPCGTIWETVPHDVIRGVSTCPKCCVAKRRSLEEAQNYMLEATNGEYSISGEYNGIRVKSLVQHVKCGHTWMVLPYDVARGKSSCGRCIENRKTRFDSSNSATLYFLHFTALKQPIYKIGITHRKVEDRYKGTDWNLLEKVWEITFEEGGHALELERYFLSISRKVNTKLLSSGNTETIENFISQKSALDEAIKRGYKLLNMIPEDSLSSDLSKEF